jgi:hypothetical protein
MTVKDNVFRTVTGLHRAVFNLSGSRVAVSRMAAVVVFVPAA